MGNTNPLVLQLIPSSVGGVSDYADVLKSGGLDGSVVKLTEGDRPTFLGDETVLLHYSGYGYARRGAPVWLLHWLREERPRIRRLGVFFHELYASGPPWKSEFWLSPLQRHIARQIAVMSDFWLANRQASAQWLNIGQSNTAHAVLPIPSGIGEFSAAHPCRDPVIVVFGGAGLRTATYRAAEQHLSRWTHTTGLRIQDIGPPITDSKVLQFMKSLQVSVLGRIPADSASSLLSKAQFGLVAYPLAFAAKSSVIGAYCAHGLCPVILTKEKTPADGLLPGANCLVQIPDQLSDEYRHRISESARCWYSPHSVENHVKKIADLSVDQSGKSCW